MTNTTNRSPKSRCRGNIRLLLQATHAAEAFFDAVAPLARAAAIELVAEGEVTAEGMVEALADMTEAE